MLTISFMSETWSVAHVVATFASNIRLKWGRGGGGIVKGLSLSVTPCMCVKNYNIIVYYYCLLMLYLCLCVFVCMSTNKPQSTYLACYAAPSLTPSPLILLNPQTFVHLPILQLRKSKLMTSFHQPIFVTGELQAARRHPGAVGKKDQVEAARWASSSCWVGQQGLFHDLVSLQLYVLSMAWHPEVEVRREWLSESVSQVKYNYRHFSHLKTRHLIKKIS